jgi:single-stranded DNA-specific DHH superfamily exonuclease
MGNPAPVFACRKAALSSWRIFGRDSNHARLAFNCGLEGVFWRGARHLELLNIRGGSNVDIVFRVSWNTFHDKPSIEVKDLGELFGNA